MKYRLANGETVRVRTCNDHVLVVVADAPTEEAGLNIEGTDHLLIVMPEVPRKEGPIVAYFLPTRVAIEAVRATRAAWLASEPSTKGNNRTWSLWFNDSSQTAGGFAQKWSTFKLSGRAATRVEGSAALPNSGTKSLGVVIAEARAAIARVAGVQIDSVKISVSLD